METNSASVGAWTPRSSTRSDGREPAPVRRRFDSGLVARPPPPEMLARARASATHRPSLPTRRPTAASVPQSRPAVPVSPPKRLLLIDPERSFGAALTGWIGGKAEYNVVQVGTLHNAAAVLRAGGVELIVACVELPDGNSLALMSDPSIGQIPKLFLSEQARVYRQQLKGDVPLLEKPVSPIKVREWVRSQSAPVAPDELEGPPTIPFTVPRAEVRDFEEVVVEARAQLTRRDYAGAIKTLQLARSMRPDDEGVLKSLQRLQSLGFDIG